MTCPHCRATLAVAESLAGKNVTCGGCGGVVTVDDARAAFSAGRRTESQARPADDGGAAFSFRRNVLNLSVLGGSITLFAGVVWCIAAWSAGHFWIEPLYVVGAGGFALVHGLVNGPERRVRRARRSMPATGAAPRAAVLPGPDAGSGAPRPSGLVRTCPKCQERFATTLRRCPQCGADYRDAMDVRQFEHEEATQFRFQGNAEGAADLFKAGGKPGIVAGGILLVAAGVTLFVLLWRHRQLDILNVFVVLTFGVTGIVILVRALRPLRKAEGRGGDRRPPSVRRRP